jgi:hypothetical protein
MPIRETREPIHRVLNDSRTGAVEWIDCLARLKVDVGILRRAAKDRPIGSQRAVAMRANQFHIDQGAQIVVGKRMNLVQLVRGAEAVEKVQERDARFERSSLGDRREILRLLHGIGGQHRETGRPRRHHVAMVAEYRERVRGNRACRDVNHASGEFARNFEHVGDHQQQALRRGEGGGKRSRLQRAMQGSGRAALALHLD